MTVYGPKSGHQKPVLARPLDADALFADGKAVSECGGRSAAVRGCDSCRRRADGRSACEGEQSEPLVVLRALSAGVRGAAGPRPTSLPRGQCGRGHCRGRDRGHRRRRPLGGISPPRRVTPLRRPKRCRWPLREFIFTPATGEHGTEWGTVIHLLLETAMVRPGADLHQLARTGTGRGRPRCQRGRRRRRNGGEGAQVRHLAPGQSGQPILGGGSVPETRARGCTAARWADCRRSSAA